MDPSKTTSQAVYRSAGAGEQTVSCAAGLAATTLTPQQSTSNSSRSNSRSSGNACDVGGDTAGGDSATRCPPQASRRSTASPEIIMQSTEGSLLNARPEKKPVSRLEKNPAQSDSVDDSSVNHPPPRHGRSTTAAEQPFRLLQLEKEAENQKSKMSPSSFETDAAAQFKIVADRFRALMERRERKLEEALSDPLTRADLEAMFPMMKYGDYQTLLAGVRGMEEGDFQTLLDGARKRRRESTGGDAERGDRKLAKILHHPSYSRPERSSNPGMPWSSWDREPSTTNSNSNSNSNSHNMRGSGYPYGRDSWHRYPPPLDPDEKSLYNFHDSRSDPHDPYPRYERYNGTGGAGGGAGVGEGRIPPPYPYPHPARPDGSYNPSWGNHYCQQWRASDRSPSWGRRQNSNDDTHGHRLSPSSTPAVPRPVEEDQLVPRARLERGTTSTDVRKPVESNFPARPKDVRGGQGGDECGPQQQAFPSNTSGVPSISHRPAAAGGGTGSQGVSSPTRIASAPPAPVGPGHDEPPPYVARDGPPGAQPSIDPSLCEAVDRVFQYREFGHGGDLRRSPSGGAGHGAGAEPRSDERDSREGGGGHGDGGGRRVVSSADGVTRMMHLLQRYQGRVDELMADPKIRAEIEALFPGMEEAKFLAMIAECKERQKLDPIGDNREARPEYHVADEAYRRDRERVYARRDGAHPEEPEYGLYPAVLRKRASDIDVPTYRTEHPNHYYADRNTAYVGSGDVKNGEYSESRGRGGGDWNGREFRDAREVAYRDARSAPYVAHTHDGYTRDELRQGNPDHGGHDSQERREKQQRQERERMGSSAGGPSYYPNGQGHVENGEGRTGSGRQGRPYKMGGEPGDVSETERQVRYCHPHHTPVATDRHEAGEGGPLKAVATASMNHTSSQGTLAPPPSNQINPNVDPGFNPSQQQQRQHRDGGTVGEASSSHTDSCGGITKTAQNGVRSADCTSPEPGVDAVGSRCSTPCRVSGSASPAADAGATVKVNASSPSGAASGRCDKGQHSHASDNLPTDKDQPRAEEFATAEAFGEVVKDKSGFTRLCIPENPPIVPRRPPSKGNKRETLSDIAHRIPVAVMRPYFNYPLRTAAEAMNISVTTLKRLCRRHGVKRWPHRQISGINRAMAHLEFQQDQEGRGVDTGGKRQDPHITDQMQELLRRRQVMIEQAFESDDGHRQSAFDSEDDNGDADSFFTERRSPGDGLGDGAPPTNHMHATPGGFSLHTFPHLHQRPRPENQPVNDHRPAMPDDGRFGAYYRSNVDTNNERAHSHAQAPPMTTQGYIHPEADGNDSGRAAHQSTPPVARSSHPIPQPQRGHMQGVDTKQELLENHSEDSARPAPSLSLPAARAGVGGRFSIHVPPPQQKPLITHSRSRSPVDAARHQPRSPLTCGPVTSWHDQGRTEPAPGSAGEAAAAAAAAEEAASQHQQRRSSSDGGHQSWSSRDHGLGVGQSSRAGPPGGSLPELSGFTRLPNQAEVFSRS